MELSYVATLPIILSNTVLRGPNVRKFFHCNVRVLKWVYETKQTTNQAMIDSNYVPVQIKMIH
ncbi:hypothetical protein WN55_03259 [Dufourea novaeangliae]|uniref:Uncharacterized protein n=1 Tax=Dufourea novaeangliae TaxID=178035 RepID=A0A154PLL9_DUFNO|nr:hypothetical protein WN55_03259 [Dufourea novaeangliae]